MKKHVVVFALLALWSCGKKSSSSDTSEKSSAGKGPVAQVSAAKIEDKTFEHKNETGIFQATSLASGPSAIILDANALKQVYTPVFGANPGRQNTADGFFSDDEIKSLGTYRITPNGNAARMTALVEVNQDYIRALRNFLGASCKKLVEAEMTAGATGNKLYKGSLLTAEDMSAFMTRMYGYEPLAGLHDGSSEYKAVFEKLVNTPKAPANDGELKSRLKNASILTCVAVGSDPRVYLR